MGDLVQSGVHNESTSRYWEREAAFHRARANETLTRLVKANTAYLSVRERLDGLECALIAEKSAAAEDCRNLRCALEFWKKRSGEVEAELRVAECVVRYLRESGVSTGPSSTVCEGLRFS